MASTDFITNTVPLLPPGATSGQPSLGQILLKEVYRKPISVNTFQGGEADIVLNCMVSNMQEKENSSNVDAYKALMLVQQTRAKAFAVYFGDLCSWNQDFRQ